MNTRIRVMVVADEPISQAGLTAQLRGRPEVEIVEQAEEAQAALVAASSHSEWVLGTVRALRLNSNLPVTLVVMELDDGQAMQVIEAGATAILRRADASAEQLCSAIASSTRGEGALPADVLGRVLNQVRRVQDHLLRPRGFSFNGVSDREADVLRLLAEGWDTSQIAGKLCYSERTIKNVIHDVTCRFGLRNRCHAVAYAVRHGLI